MRACVHWALARQEPRIARTADWRIADWSPASWQFRDLGPSRVPLSSADSEFARKTAPRGPV
eukprot:7970489-Alexandrium_andersonii.AAC.1